MSSARRLGGLTLDHARLINYANITTASFPRISPELKCFAKDGTSIDAGAALTGEGGWGLGPGWESLVQLHLVGLSQNGVSLSRLRRVWLLLCSDQ